MTQFQGPIQLANDQWVRSLTMAGTGVPPVSPTRSTSELIQESADLARTRGALAAEVARQRWQQKRSELIDRGILRRREEDPEGEEQKKQMRAVPRMTIAEINRMARPQMQQLLKDSGGKTVGDQRGSFIKFLDFIDMPRDSILMSALAEEQDLEELAWGAGVTAGVGGIAGAITGGIAGGTITGGPGAVPGAALGGAKGAAMGAGLYTVAAGTANLLSRTLLDKEQRDEILRIASKNERGGFDRPRIWFSDVLEGLGVENAAARAILGFAGDVLIDPLTYLSGGGSLVKWGSKGVQGVSSGTRYLSRLLAVDQRGAKYLKHSADEMIREGKMIGGKLVLPEGSLYKNMEHLINNNIVLKASDDVPETLMSIAPGIDRSKRIKEAMEAVGTATGMTRKQHKAARSKIVAALQDDLIAARSFLPANYTNVNILKMGEASHEFFRRFQARADLQIHVPFAEIVSPLFYRKMGYKNLGQIIPFLPSGFRLHNIPLSFIPGPRRAQYRALMNTDEAFLAAENAARLMRQREIMTNVGRYSGTTLVHASKTLAAMGELHQTLPQSLRKKINFSITDSPLSRVEGRTVNKGVRIGVTELDANEYKFLKEQGWKLEIPAVSRTEDVVDEAALIKALEARDRITRIDGYSDVMRYVDDYKHLEPSIAESQKNISILAQTQAAVRKMHVEQLEAGTLPMKPGGDLDSVTRLKEIEKDISKTQSELDSLFANQSLDIEQIQSLLSQRSSEILDAADGVYGGVSGVSLGMYGGPGILGRMFRGHNIKGAEINERLNSVLAEKRQGSQVIDKIIHSLQKTNALEGDKIADLRSAQSQLDNDIKQLVGPYVETSDVGRAKAEEFGPLFGMGPKEEEMFARVLDAIGDAAARAKGGTKEDWLNDVIKVVKGGATPEGRVALFQQMSTGFSAADSTKKLSSVRVMLEGTRRLANSNELSNLKPHGDDLKTIVHGENGKGGLLSLIGDLKKAEDSPRVWSGFSRLDGGYAAGGMVWMPEGLTEAKVLQIAHTIAAQKGSNAVRLFMAGEGSGIQYVLPSKNMTTKDIMNAMDDVGIDYITDPKVAAGGVSPVVKPSVSVADDGTVVIFTSNRRLIKHLGNQIAELKGKLNVEEEVKGITGKVIERSAPAGSDIKAAKQWHWHQADGLRHTKGTGGIIDEGGFDYIRALRDRNPDDFAELGQDSLGNPLPTTVYKLSQAVRAIDRGIRKGQDWDAERWLKELSKPAFRGEANVLGHGWPYIDPHTGRAYAPSQDEIKWSGINDWLTQNLGKSKTGDEIEQFLQATQIKVVAVDAYKAGKMQAFMNEGMASIDNLLRGGLTRWEGPSPEVVGALEHLKTAIQQQDANLRAIEWEKYVEGGNIAKVEPDEGHIRLVFMVDPAANTFFQGAQNPMGFLDPKTGVRKMLESANAATLQHWGNALNQMFHVSGTKRIYNGKKTFQIEEIQSDMVQGAKKAGDYFMRQVIGHYNLEYDPDKSLLQNILKSDKVPDEVKAIAETGGIGRGPIDEYIAKYMPTQTFDSDELTVAIDRAYVGERAAGRFVDDIPFAMKSMVQQDGVKPTKQWERTAIRQALKYAVDENYELITISDGREMAKVLSLDGAGQWPTLFHNLPDQPLRWRVIEKTYDLLDKGHKGEAPEIRATRPIRYTPMMVHIDQIVIRVDRADGMAIEGQPHLAPGMIGDVKWVPSLDGKSIEIQIPYANTQGADISELYPASLVDKMVLTQGQSFAVPLRLNEGLERHYESIGRTLESVAEELGAPLASDRAFGGYRDSLLDLDLGPIGYPGYDDNLNMVAINLERFVSGATHPDDVPHIVNAIRPAVEELSRRINLIPSEALENITELPRVHNETRDLIGTLLRSIEIDEEILSRGLLTKARTSFFNAIQMEQPLGIGTKKAYQISENLRIQSKQHGDELWQMGDGNMARASVEFTESGKSVIRAFEKADLGSAVHEVGHVIRRSLDDKASASLSNYFKVEGEIWPVLQEERFTQAFMQFIQDGKAPTPELQEAFDVLSDAMGLLYQKNYDVPMRGGLRRALNSAFGATPADVKRAKSYRQSQSQLTNVNRTLNTRIGHQVENLSNIEELATKKDMLRNTADEVAAPLREELNAHNSTFTQRAAQIAERFDRTFRNVTGAGRRYTPPGQAVSRLRHGLENTPAMESRMFLNKYDDVVKTISKKYGMSSDDANMLLNAKLMELEISRGRIGYHASDPIHKIRVIISRYGDFDDIWNDPQIVRLAEKINDGHRNMAIYEASVNALKTIDPQFGYVPLRITDEASRQSFVMNAARRETQSGRGLTVREGATYHRDTNQHWFPVENGGRHIDDDGQNWDFIWTGELNSGAPQNPAYEMYRLARLREKPELMLPGDVFDYNLEITKRGGSVEQHMPGGIENGGNWHVEPTPVSAYGLQEHATELRHKFGNEFVDAVWEKDLGLVLANRVKQHHRIRAVSEFMENIAPEIKILPTDHVEDLVRNPRQGVTASSNGSEVLINNVPYRRLNNKVVQSDTVTSLLGQKSKDSWYPEELASAIEDYLVRITDDENIHTIAKAFDYVQSIWKGSVLLHPGWTTVNILGGIIHSIVVGGLGLSDFINHYPTARRLSQAFHFGDHRGLIVPSGRGLIFDDAKSTILGADELTDTDLARHLVKINAIDGSQVAREIMTTHRTAFSNPSLRAKKGVAGWIRHIATLGPVGSWWFKFNASIDDAFRTTVYLARRAKGDTIDAAELTMKRAHFDYGSFTAIEGTIGRRVVPFYAWMRNNIGLQFAMLVEKPAYAASMQKINHVIEEALGHEEKVPEWMLPRYMKNQLIAQIAGDDGSRKALNIGSLTPIQDLAEIGQGLYGVEGFERMFKYFLNSASPVLKLPLEIALGEQSFTGRGIGDPDLGEMSITEYMLSQIGYWNSIKGMNKAVAEGGLTNMLFKLAVRGRWQDINIEKLQMMISIDEGEDIKDLRRTLNRRYREGDEEAAERIAMRIIEKYRLLYLGGLKDRVPKELHPVFNREKAARRRGGIPEPGGWIPQQQPVR